MDVRLGAWNEGEGDPSIASCDDDRLRPAPAGVVVLEGPGTWRVAACGAGRVFVRPNGMAVTVAPRPQPWTAQIKSHGKMCGVPAVVGISGEKIHGDIVATAVATGKRMPLAFMEAKTEIGITSSVPGIVRIVLQDDWHCPVALALEFANAKCSPQARIREEEEEDPSSSPSPSSPESPSPQPVSILGNSSNFTHSASQSATVPPEPYNGSNGIDGVNVAIIFISISVVILLLIIFYSSAKPIR